MRPRSRAAAATVAAGAGLALYSTLVERRWYRLRHVTMSGVLRRPGARLRVLHVSDVHLVPRQEHRIRFLATLADLPHDLVVATGDLLGWVDAERLTADAMAPLTSGGRPGLVVLGSNDRYAPVPKSPIAYLTAPQRRTHGAPLDTPRLVAHLEHHGYETLVDARTTVDTAAGRVEVGGIDDPHLAFGAGRAPHEVLPDVTSIAATDDDAVLHLGLVHAPYRAALDLLVDGGHGLLLAGHTHGGQIRVPGYGAVVANCDIPLDQARGTSAWRGRALHVSPGLGHSAYAPARLACRPEATLIELRG